MTQLTVEGIGALSTVEEIEALTLLRFSNEARDADIRRGARPESALDFGLDGLHPAEEPLTLGATALNLSCYQ